MSFKDRVVIVTGAAKGIGRVIAKRYCDEKANVIIVDIDYESGKKCLEMLTSSGNKAEFFEVDVSKSEDIDSFMQKVEQRYGRVDVLINNAGISVWKPPEELMVDAEPHSEAYAASKGGIIALTQTLAASYAKDHIRVNCISPGWIQTQDYDQLREIDHLQHFSQRVGKPDDIASACIYLTHGSNDFILGTNLVIDGGMTKKMMYRE
ncbi:hypothetical protein BHU72_02005 [Desulfuribacillus stibiiarsenatis]|uniref:3-ketoacyl-ACP reductase n=1 Tax=Desulfuribacillus stibiiarsenatis TaxID=1390249 RepID=A0A1E5L623_9FIRM|nr:SDR family oxidoreductase [Desulfuribacillus stibiiarsenatis]OEH85597.1 hypothetical protein BHU72_02005 [Desulfuribacillus stibiiarsenatis]